VCDWLLPCNVSDAPIGTDNPEGGGCRRFEVKDVILKRFEWNQVSGMFDVLMLPSFLRFPLLSVDRRNPTFEINFCTS
jgi:hypothetical protein